LAALTHTLVVGMISMSMPVLFQEIAADLNMNLVQIGVVWGMTSLTGIVMGLAGGAIGDRFGAKRTLVVSCLAAGVTAALPGFAFNFASLAVASFLAGLFLSVIPTNVHKTCGIWFSGRRLGLANGVVSTGMAFGFMLGSLLAATVLSPWLGGWRQVFFFYAAIDIVIALLWAVTRAGPDGDRGAQAGRTPTGLRAGFAHVMRLSSIWWLGLAMLGVGSCIQGALGYLPLYLRDLGWPEAAADSTLALFHFVSMVCTIPLAMLSDRLGSRMRILVISTCLTAAGIGALAFVDGWLILVAVLVAGTTRDGFMAVLMTQIIELDGVGAAFAGTATGLIMAASRLGGVVAPPLGNSLAAIDPGLPFLFWAALALVGLLGFAAVSRLQRRVAAPAPL
jgi:MFS family permease